jgi:hypothetical protein
LLLQPYLAASLAILPAGLVSLLLLQFVLIESPFQGCLDAPSVAESFSDKKYWIVPTDFDFLSVVSKSNNQSDSAQV